MTEGPERGRFLPNFLVCMLALIALSAVGYLLTKDQTRREWPLSYILAGDRFHRSPFGISAQWEPELAVLLGLYSLTCAIAILHWRPWGLLGFLAAPAAVSMVNLAAGVNLLVPILAFLGPAMYRFFSTANLDDQFARFVRAVADAPAHSAVAVVKDSEGWAWGGAWSAATVESARASAISNCESAARHRNVTAPCRIYAVDGSPLREQDGTDRA